MTGYLSIVEKATSVKRIGVLQSPTANSLGIADFTYRPVFSVFDFGTIVPPVLLDNSTVSLMAGFNFELLRERGIDSHYYGLITDKEKRVSAKEIILHRLDPPRTMRVKYANRLMPEFRDGKWDYSMFGKGDITCYIQPIEFISRNSLPESSSVWKRIKRGEISLEDLGLPSDFKVGDNVSESLAPILDYSTKFEPDDRYLSPKKAKELMGVSDGVFEDINEITRAASRIMTDYAASRGFKREDGKVEIISQNISPEILLADAVCTWHEDRLTFGGIGISKQRIRDQVKVLNPQWYGEIERAKQEAVDRGIEDFRTLMNPSITYVSPSPEFFEAINNLFRAGTNQWVGSKVYDVYPGQNNSLVSDLEKTVEKFQEVIRR